MSDVHHKSHLTKDPVDEYIIEKSLREHPVMKELREHTLANVDWSVMLSDPVQVQFFQILLKSINAKKCIEVGAYTGYNVLNCALTIPDDGVVYALDISEDFLNHGIPFFEKANVSHKVKRVIAPAADSLDGLLKEGQAATFDFVYIDADKTGYGAYYEKALQLVRAGGLVVLDNMLYAKSVLDVDKCKNEKDRKNAISLRDLALKIKDDTRVDISFLKIGDGALIARKK